MSMEIQTPFGTPLPPAPRHAITVHVPAWKTMIRFKERDPELFKEFKSMYPRFVLHKDVNELTQRIITFANLDAQVQGCYIFPSLQAATDCVEFATSPARKEGTISHDKISIRIFMTHIPLYTVVFPVELTATVHGFWLNASTSISSRLAEDSIEHSDSLRELQPDEELAIPTDSAAHSVIKERIAGLLNRAQADPSRTVKVASDDVYFFTTGMSAIYWVHRHLLKKYSEHHNDFCARDAEQLVVNSRDYLPRSAILNNNASSVVAFLQRKALDPSSSVAQVFYPTTNPSHKNYSPFLRQPTTDFPSPGYGCLFSVEFADMTIHSCLLRQSAYPQGTAFRRSSDNWAGVHSWYLRE